MNRRAKVISLAVVFVLASAVSLFAHDTWLIAEKNNVDVHSLVLMRLTSAEQFPIDDFVVDAARLNGAFIRLGGKRIALRVIGPQKLHLTLSARADTEGVGALWVALKPRRLELKAKLIEEYLGEIGATPAQRARWDSLPQPRRWREEYTKHAKSFVRVGKAAGDGSWATPVGLALEIVPERDPTTLHSGDTLGVQVLSHGAPMAGFALFCQHETDAAVMHTTDASGRTSCPLGAAGRWLLKGTDLRATSRPELEWASDFTTLTVRVQ